MADCCHAAFVALHQAKDGEPRLTAEAARAIIERNKCPHLLTKEQGAAFVVYDLSPAGQQRHVLGWNGGMFY